jgi:hypothetical protein
MRIGVARSTSALLDTEERAAANGDGFDCADIGLRKAGVIAGHEALIDGIFM